MVVMVHEHLLGGFRALAVGHGDRGSAYVKNCRVRESHSRYDREIIMYYAAPLAISRESPGRNRTTLGRRRRSRGLCY